MWTMAGIGAALAGVFLMLRALLPWLEAKRSGVIRTQGARPVRVERAVEPGRFQGLCRNRLKAVLPGLAMFMAGGVFTFLQVAAIMAIPAQ